MNRSLVEQIKYSPFSRIAALPMRSRSVLAPLMRFTGHGLRWLARSREYVNYSYNYEPAGLLSIAAAIAQMTGVDPRVVRGYATELKADQYFADRYRQRVTQTRLKYISDPELCLGKCLIYYLLVRASGALTVFEAGTDQGLGALAICRALSRNAGPGQTPQLITVDIATDRGELLEGDENGLAVRLIGDSVAHLASAHRPIDCFIHDTTSDADHTRAQFAALSSHLARDAVVFTSWFTQEFVDFSETAGLAYIELVERPSKHWYSGRRCGLATLRRAAWSESGEGSRALPPGVEGGRIAPD